MPCLDPAAVLINTCCCGLHYAKLACFLTTRFLKVSAMLALWGSPLLYPAAYFLNEVVVGGFGVLLTSCSGKPLFKIFGFRPSGLRPACTSNNFLQTHAAMEFSLSGWQLDFSRLLDFLFSGIGLGYAQLHLFTKSAGVRVFALSSKVSFEHCFSHLFVSFLQGYVLPIPGSNLLQKHAALDGFLGELLASR